MANEEKTKLRLEIAHILFFDIVGYSKLLIDEQSEAQTACGPIPGSKICFNEWA